MLLLFYQISIYTRFQFIAYFQVVIIRFICYFNTFLKCSIGAELFLYIYLCASMTHRRRPPFKQVLLFFLPPSCPLPVIGWFGVDGYHSVLSTWRLPLHPVHVTVTIPSCPRDGYHSVLFTWHPVLQRESRRCHEPLHNVLERHVSRTVPVSWRWPVPKCQTSCALPSSRTLFVLWHINCDTPQFLDLLYAVTHKLWHHPAPGLFVLWHINCDTTQLQDSLCAVTHKLWHHPAPGLSLCCDT